MALQRVLQYPSGHEALGAGRGRLSLLVSKDGNFLPLEAGNIQGTAYPHVKFQHCHLLLALDEISLCKVLLYTFSVGRQFDQYLWAVDKQLGGKCEINCVFVL